MERPTRIGIALLACVVIAGGVASAQTKTGQGPLVLEPTSDGPVVVPEVKFGDFDGDTGTLLGAHGGWLFDNRLLLGAGASFLIDHDYNDRVSEMSYFGVVAGWAFPLNKFFSGGARALVGGGWAGLNDTYDYYLRMPGQSMFPRYRSPGWRPPVSGPIVGSFYFEDDFFIFEPQATAVVRLARGFAIDVSGGYRLIGGLGHYNSWLDGASVSVGVRIGPRI